MFVNNLEVFPDKKSIWSILISSTEILFFTQKFNLGLCEI